MKLPYSDYRSGTAEHTRFVRSFIRAATDEDYEADRGAVGAPSIGRALQRGTIGGWPMMITVSVVDDW